MKKFVQAWLAIGAFALAAPLSVYAQGYPTKPIHIIVAHAPGGPVDVVARLLAPKLQQTLGQPIVVENRTGAGGNIGTVAVAKAPADGYTVLANSSAYAVNPSLTPNAGYDPERDLIAVVVVASQPNLIVVNSNLPVKNLAELIKLSKTAKLAYASPGSGTTPHLTAENLFRAISKVDVPVVHFRGAGPAAAAVVGGEPSVGSLAVTAAIPHIKSGRLRALAISSATRVPALPDVPTFIEAGFPSIQDYTWVGFFMPAGSPSEAVEKMNDAVNRALQAPDVRERLAALAFDPVGGTPQHFTAYVKTEVVKWAKVVQETGAKLE
jgi:tripartite-type tricarboxylate transporter receptor subunit TctC